MSRHGLGLACNCATDPPKQRRRCWSKALRSKDPASLPMCTTSRQTRRDGLDRLLRTLLTANDKLFKKTVPVFCSRKLFLFSSHPKLIHIHITKAPRVSVTSIIQDINTFCGDHRIALVGNTRISQDSYSAFGPGLKYECIDLLIEHNATKVPINDIITNRVDLGDHDRTFAHFWVL